MADYTKTISEELAVLDRRSWSDLSLTWDDYTLTWDDYGDMPVYIQKGYHRTLTETITNSPTIQTILIYHRTLTETITHTLSVAKTTARTLTDALTHTEAFSRVFTAIREVQDWMNLGLDRIIKIIKKPQTETITMTETITKTATRTLIETLHLTEAFSRLAVFSRTLLDTLTISEYDWTWDKMTLTWDDYTQSWDEYRDSLWVRIITLKAVSDTLNLADSLSKKAIKNLTDAISHSETMTRVIKLLRTETLAMTEYLSFQLNLGLMFSDTITLTENFYKLFREFFTGAIARIKNQTISGTIKQNRISGRISDAPGIIEGRIREIQTRGNIENQDIIGRIKQN